MTTINKTSFTINGQNYNSIDEMPPEIQELIKDTNGNGIPDKFELTNMNPFNSVNKTSVQNSSHTVTTSDGSSENVQQLIRDINGNGIPDQFEEQNAIPQTSAIQMDHMQAEINKKGLFILLIVALAIIGYILF